jgi:16S rRNA (guanine1516-N2)-methyltransferase
MILSIGYDGDNQDKVHELALLYNLNIDDALPRLNLTSKRLELLVKDFLPLSVDFEKSFEKPKDSLKKHGLIKACRPESGVKILDLTAGWGRDSAILARFGAEVLMLERQGAMAALLADGLKRFDFGGLLKLNYIDAKDYLNNTDESFDVIYIDPMHPQRQKSALVKKDMQALQQLFGADLDAKELIDLAMGRAKKRVVVKWPQKLLALIKPKHSINGSTVRFDIY